MFSFSFFFAEIARVRASLFQINGVKKEPLMLPEPEGATVSLNEKVYVPVREHPDVSTTTLHFIVFFLIIEGKIKIQYTLGAIAPFWKHFYSSQRIRCESRFRISHPPIGIPASSFLTTERETFNRFSICR